MMQQRPANLLTLTPRPPCRSIFSPAANGAWNMALDEVLLRTAVDEGRWTLRFYGWSAPTLSLGYFQRWDDRQRHAASLACDCVRRASGGGAIVHDRELTYSLAVPPSDRWSASAEALYGRVHQSLVTMLGQLGIEAELQAGTDKLPPAEAPFLCFQRRSGGDVIVRGSKVAGSAQRRWRGAVLQHGSVLLNRSANAPELPALNDSRADLPDWRSFAETWQPLLAESLELDWQNEEASNRELLEARLLAEEKYRQASWNRRR
jgi:lipoate-protein ligase A